MAEIRDFKSGKNNVPPGGAMPRRLAPVVRADLSGYSRLMQLGEEGTHNRVKRIERDLIEPTITEHHGRLVKTTGDGLIPPCADVYVAVRCSIVIQQNLVGRNASLPRDLFSCPFLASNSTQARTETDDIYGDGVNIA